MNHSERKNKSRNTADIPRSANNVTLLRFCQSQSIFSSNPWLQIWSQACPFCSVACSFGFLTRSSSGPGPTDVNNSAWEIIRDSEANEEAEQLRSSWTSYWPQSLNWEISPSLTLRQLFLFTSVTTSLRFLLRAKVMRTFECRPRAPQEDKEALLNNPLLFPEIKFKLWLVYVSCLPLYHGRRNIV